MLDELRIADLGVIEDVTLRFAPGLTVITGETGAGKTMLVTALELLLGARADAELVRAGTEAAAVEARVVPVPPTAADWVGPDDDELVVWREVSTGPTRSRARIGGRLAPVSALADVLGRWVEVHTQGEHVRLTRPDVQRALLDRYAGEPHARVLAAYRRVWDELQEVQRRLRSLESDARERARELDRLRFEVDEIARAGIDPDRDGAISEDLARLEHAEELVVAAGEARTALGEDGAGEALGRAVAALRAAGDHDRELDRHRDRLESLVAEIDDLRFELGSYAESVEADPQHLNELRDRQRVLGDLLRKYGPDLASVTAYAGAAASRLAGLEGDEASTDELEDRAATLGQEVERLARDVRQGRVAAAERLAVEVERHLADLAMEAARFGVRIEAREPSGHGADTVEFELAANPGEPPRPLATAASGGERSRVALAIEVALADVDEAEVLVFDEIDAGVGGATALAVGEKLAALASGGRQGTSGGRQGTSGGRQGTSGGRPGTRGGRQVLCVTHLAQLAAFADVHYVVEKGLRDGRTVTSVRVVEDDDRPSELVRMLSGAVDRGAGLAHARELLDEARSRRAG